MQIKLKHTTLLFLLLTSFSWGDVYQDYMSYGWGNIFAMGRSILWVLAIIPAIVVGAGIYYSYLKLKKEQEEKSRSGSSGTAMSLEDLGSMLFYTIGSLSAVFLIYGMFGMIFAGTESMGYAWEHLVFDFWKDLFNPGANTSP